MEQLIEKLKEELRYACQVAHHESKNGEFDKFGECEYWEKKVDSLREVLFKLTGDDNFNNDPEVRSRMAIKWLKELRNKN